MKRSLLFIFWQFCLLPGAHAFIDVVMLTDGGQVPGTVESGNQSEIRIRTSDGLKVLRVDQIRSITITLSLQAGSGYGAADSLSLVLTTLGTSPVLFSVRTWC